MKKIYLIALFLVSLNSYAQVIRYVKTVSSGLGNGTSWANASSNLQAMIEGVNVEQVWVAAGTYYPTHNTNRDYSFNMKNGVAIYGGFPNTGTPVMADRNFANNPTILSGNIGNLNDSTDNSKSVIFNGNLSSSAILDGFTISDGYGGFGGLGAGIYNSLSSPTISNCIIKNNVASNNGGGMFNYIANPNVTNCVFYNNTANLGGAVFTTTSSTVNLTNCTIANNNAVTSGAGIYYTSGGTATVNNCILWGNGSEYSGFGTAPTFNNSFVSGVNIGGFSGSESPLFENAAASNYQLQFCSPLVNAGNNSYNNTTIDANGNTRKYNNGTIDLGAYELQINVPAAITWYQDADNDGYGNNSVSQMAICKPTGYVANNLDCNDANTNAQLAPVATTITAGSITLCTGGSVTLTSSSVGGNGLLFNGTSQYIITPNLTSNITANSFTIELWFKASSAGVILSELGQNAINSGYHASNLEILSNGNVLARVWNLNAVNLGTISFNTWNHVVIRYDNTNSTLDGFLNGVIATTNSIGTKQTPPAYYWAFGAPTTTNLGSGGYFSGEMDEIRIWNGARSYAQIIANYANTVAANSSNLVAYYKLDNTTGTIVTDATANGLHGTCFVANAWNVPSTSPLRSSFSWNTAATTASINVNTVATYNTIITTGCGSANSNSITTQNIPTLTAPGNAINFNGTNNFATLNTPLTSPTTYTLEAWFRTTTAGGPIIGFHQNQTNFSNVESNDRSIYLDATGKLNFGVYDGGLNIVTSTNAYNDGRYHHVAATCSQTNGIKLYVDGVLVAQQATISNPLFTYTGYWRLGGVPNWSNIYYFNGSIDEVRIWNTERTLTEIQNNFLNVIATNTAGLLNYFRMDDATAGADNTAKTTLQDYTCNNAATLYNFTLNGSSSNWVESYAMVVPTAITATNVGPTSFTANWSAPTVGAVSNYLLDVSTNNNFTSFIPNYNGASVSGTSRTILGLSPTLTYYYRVRANKTSVANEGNYSNTISATTAVTCSGTILYVDSSKADGGNGTSWATAFNNLQDALSVAKNCSNITQIWVAKGTYFPSLDINGNPNPANARNKTFAMLNGVGIYGGFPNTGNPNFNDRNTTINPTILSGDIGVVGDDADNCFRIFYHFYGTSDALLNTAILDGFTISNASSTALYNVNARPTINNCIFFNNKGGNGGAVFNSTNSSTIFTNCTFTNNFSSGSGSVMYNENSSNITVTNCVFNNNLGTNNGGVILISSCNNVTIQNSSFSNNTCYNQGGVFYIESSTVSITNSLFASNTGFRGGVAMNSGASPVFTNCTFVNNVGSASAINAGTFYNLYSSNPIVRNSIAWGNNSNDESFFSSGITYQNSFIQGTTNGGFVGNENPMFVNAATGNFQLQATSPFINVGNNSYIAGFTTDLLGNQRIQNVTVDLGAYEFTTLTTTWNGTTWSSGAPSSTIDAIIASNTAPASFYCKNLTINSGSALTTTGITATIHGNITNSGNGIAGTGGLTIANNSTLSGNAISFNGVLTVNSGANLTTGGLLTLTSNATNTARVANSAGNITGNITVERYFANKRAWRFIAAPTFNASTVTLSTGWQTQTHIVGPSGTGLDATKPSYSFFTYTANSWVGINNTTTTTQMTEANGSGAKAFAAFLTGDRSVNINSLVASSAVTLSSTGSLLTGNQTVSLGTPAAGSYHFLANPYASPVDLNEVFLNGTTANINRTFYTWDPTLSGTGGYVTISWNGSSYDITPTSAQTQHIQSGQAFFVQATANAATTVVFEENDKSTSTINNVFGVGNGNIDRLNINLQRIDNGSLSTRDGVMASFGAAFSKAIVATEDADKLFNNEEGITIRRNNKSLSIERRPFITNTNDTIFLGLNRLIPNTNYTLNLNPQGWDAGMQAVLVDKLLSTETPINLQSANQDLNITSTVADVADRFMIAFRGTGNLPNNKLSLIATKKDKDVQLTWNIANEIGVKEYELQRSIDGTNFQAINNQVASSKAEYNNVDTKANNGINYYRVKMTMLNDDVRYSNVVTINLQPPTSNILIVYPNPVKGNMAQIQLNDLDFGDYTIRLIDMNGKLLQSQNIKHQGGTASRTLSLGNIAIGTYQLVLEGKGISKSVSLVKGN